MIGGLTFIDNIPGLLSHAYWAFRGEIGGIVGMEFGVKDKFTLVTRGLNVLIGLLLITNYDLISKWLKFEKGRE